MYHFALICPIMMIFHDTQIGEELHMYGEKIRDLRKGRGDTLRSLGEKLGRGHTTLQKIEKGQVKANMDLLEEIAKLYDVPMSYFLDEEIPKELKEVGVQWIEFAEEMERKELTPDQIRAAVDLILKIRNEDK